MARFLIVLGLALVCGVAASYGVLKMGKPGKAVKRVEMVDISVTTQALNRRQLVTDKNVRLKPSPRRMLQDDEMIAVSYVQGHVVVDPMVAGEPVLKVELASDDNGSRLAAPVPEGQRADSIQANTAAHSVAGFVSPRNIGDVPVNLRGKANDDTGNGTTATSLQPVEILAVDQPLEDASGKIASDLKSVTLLERRSRRRPSTWSSTLGICRCRCAIRKIEPWSSQNRCESAISSVCKCNRNKSLVRRGNGTHVCRWNL